jgi:hypothetical protein
MLDRIIVSCDDSEFSQYVPIVSKAWKKYFPECALSIAFLTERDQDDPFVEKMRSWGDVHLFRPVPNIPLPNQAKVSRHILASQFGKEICMLEDIDTIPLQRKYYEDRISAREPNHVLAVGAEVFFNTPHEGKFPMSTISAEGDTFKKFINPENLTYSELITSWVGKSIFDHKEDISNSPYIFSDESLIRALLSEWKESMITHAPRNVDIGNEWVDRSWWSIDKEKLEKEQYTTCNFLRPFLQYYNNILPIIEYIYGYIPPQEEVILI